MGERKEKEGGSECLSGEILHTICIVSQGLARLAAQTELDGPESGGGFAPSAEKAREALGCLRAAVFPGRWLEEGRRTANQDLYFQEKLSRSYALLLDEVRKAYPMKWRGAHGRAMRVPEETGDLLEPSRRILAAFFATLPEIRRRLVLDVDAAYAGDPAALSYAEVQLSYPGLVAIVTHRLAHELYRLGVPLLPRMMSEQAHGETGIDIHPGAEIGEHFFTDHGTGVVIGETTTIGKNVKIYQGVTLGAKSFPLDEYGRPVKGVKRHPTLEDDVVIYANATILGGDTVIGKGSVVGANVFLAESVPPGTTVSQKAPELRMKSRGG